MSEAGKLENVSDCTQHFKISVRFSSLCLGKKKYIYVRFLVALNFISFTWL